VKLRTVLLWLGVLRFVLAIAAIPLAPFLYEDHFVVLVLLRPTKEVLLAAGFLVGEGKVNVVSVFLGSIPLGVLGVWLYFWLGRLYAKEIRSGDLPWIAARVLTPKRIKKVTKALDKKGPRLVLLGRAAALSSASVATAAGVAKMDRSEFIKYDGLGAAGSLGFSFLAGLLLGEAYDSVGPLLTVVGISTLVAFAIVLARQLMRT
jgi:membrane protein DedA with SNARE-associated domain